ncbi:MAG: Ldh family oxidoreductase [Hyphomicrobiaceae bacterium]|nr:Ldh family oxidoreductase [Hyphomicrobiaceae bacterium]
MSGTVHLPLSELEAIISAALVASNTSGDNAAIVARALAAAELDGQKGHGLSRVPSYAAQSKSGKVDGHAKPTLERTRPGTLLVDVANGFVYPAIDMALGQLTEVARRNGIAAAGFTRSHHFGVVGHHVERLAEAGLVALAFGNGPEAMASWGGRRAIFGTNPIAFAAPLRGRPPVVVDMALSQVARGKILTAAQKGEPIPEGWAVDANGKPTTDAKAAMAGTLTPLGGAKGSALAFMVEVLGAALMGSNFGFEASSFFTGDGPPPCVGQLIVAIDAEGFAGSGTFADRMAVLAEAIEGDPGARLPGMKRLSMRAKAKADGIGVEAALLEQVRKIAAA